jgi:hypothetical protein
MYQANRTPAPERQSGEDQYFTGGALLFDGVLYKNIPESHKDCLSVPWYRESAGRAVLLCGRRPMPRHGADAAPTQLEDGDYDFVTGLV